MTKEESIARGLKRYDAPPCPKCRDTLRYTNSNRCVQCNRNNAIRRKGAAIKYQAIYCREHKERIARARKERHHRNWARLKQERKGFTEEMINSLPRFKDAFKVDGDSQESINEAIFAAISDGFCTVNDLAANVLIGATENTWRQLGIKSTKTALALLQAAGEVYTTIVPPYHTSAPETLYWVAYRSKGGLAAIPRLRLAPLDRLHYVIGI